MASRLVFCDAERSVPSLSRGWRTPDPSPTRSAVGLPRCKPSELELFREDDADATLTPRYRGGVASQMLGNSGQGRCASGSQTRTPSPQPRSSSGEFSPFSAAQCDQEEDPQIQMFCADEAYTMSHMWSMPMSPMCGQCLPQEWLAMRLEWLSTMQPTMTVMPVCALDADKAETVSPSVGSIGHEYGQCAEPCKYLNKKRGCKDGLLCDRCHLCEWKASRSRKTKIRAEL